MHHDTMLDLLSADGPHPTHRAKLMLFGQFVGSWDLDMLAYQPDGTVRRFTGQWHFGWVLEGRAIQDVLIARPLADQQIAGVTQGGIGSTLRVYDPGVDGWWVVWAGPVDGEFSTLLARQVDDRIVLDGQWRIGGEGRRFRWSFCDITTDRFHWQGHSSPDGGQTWRLVEELHARRQPHGLPERPSGQRARRANAVPPCQRQ
jgi:hypothetical protein